MLVAAVAAVRHSVVLVLRAKTQNGVAEVGAVGTACYIGNDLFLTADHLFDDPMMIPGERIMIVRFPGRGGRYSVWPTPAALELRDPADDLALLRLDGFGNASPTVRVSVGIEPDGRSVFSYGFINPSVDVNEDPPIAATPRAAPAIIGGVYGDRYELDSNTYPGESGAPVFRQHDLVVIGVAQASRRVAVPPPPNWVRGPTIASPIAPIATELAARGIAAVTWLSATPRS
jgi:hypothetical protein